MLRPIVYLPIEYESREFDSKMLLACGLIRQGIRVVIGQQWMMYANLRQLPAGVVVFKSANMIHHQAMLEARLHGHVSISFEEESLAHTQEDILEKLFAPSLFQSSDASFCVGQFEADVIRAKAPANYPIHVLGNARIELLKPKYLPYFASAIAHLNQLHGDFILINTNFAQINSVWSQPGQLEQIAIRAGWLDPNDPKSLRDWNEHIEFEQVNQALIIDLARELATKYGDTTIIIRPHPGERIEQWHAILNCRNVKVIREGSHVPWTLAAKMLIHTSCTTGFEAFVAERPVISLLPLETHYARSMLANQVTQHHTCLEDAILSAGKVLRGDFVKKTLSKEEEAIVERFVWNFGPNDHVIEAVSVIRSYLRKPTQLHPDRLVHVQRDQKLESKFKMSGEAFVESLQRMLDATQTSTPIDVMQLGDSLFCMETAQ